MPDRRTTIVERPHPRGGAPTAGDVSPGPSSPELSRLVGLLRSHVTRYVRERRADGASIECVLPEVRHLMHEAEVAEGFPDELGVLMAQVVGWSIAVYDDEPAPANGPRIA